MNTHCNCSGTYVCTPCRQAVINQSQQHWQQEVKDLYRSYFHVPTPTMGAFDNKGNYYPVGVSVPSDEFRDDSGLF